MTTTSIHAHHFESLPIDQRHILFRSWLSQAAEHRVVWTESLGLPLGDFDHESWAVIDVPHPSKWEVFEHTDKLWLTLPDVDNAWIDIAVDGMGDRHIARYSFAIVAPGVVPEREEFLEKLQWNEFDEWLAEVHGLYV